MLFQFIDTAYSFLVPVLLVWFWINKANRKIAKRSLVTANHLLIFYSWYLCKKLYDLISFLLSLKLPQPPPNAKVDITFDDVRVLLLIILPYFSLIRRVSASQLFTLLMLLLLQWSFLKEILQPYITKQPSSGILFYVPYLIEFKIIGFIGLFMAVYALLWLLKRMPNQSKLKHV